VLAGAANLVLDAGHAGTGTVLGHLSVALLLLTAAQWRRWVVPRVPASTAVHLVPLATVTSAVLLALAPQDPAAWLGVTVAAGAVAWMALRERTVSRLVGYLSLAPLAATAAAWREPALDTAPALDAAPAVVGAAWLVLTGVALAFGRSTIAR
jgi:hypothetical protein